MTGHILLADGLPAEGAATGELIAATAVGLVLVAAAALFGRAHRSGRTRILTRAGAVAEKTSGLPAWAALPAGVVGVSLIVAAFGFYWDVATHIDNGRDPGPFANPAHFLIIFGLAGIALAGYLGVLIGTKSEDLSSVRIRDGWHAPLGALLLLLCGVFAVAGFPLDDVWHRLFGQDVTLWGPTHIQMVGGASLSTLALWVLLVEGKRGRDTGAPQGVRLVQRWGEPLAAGAFLIGLSTFQGEFDYAVPQFRLLFHPVLLMLAASIALVPARIRLGRGGALKAVLFFIGLRGLFSLIIGPGFGHTTLHFPLYLAEALAVEIVALRVSTSRQISFGAWSGAAIAVAGLPAEWAWSHAWMTMSWPATLIPEALLAGSVAAIAGGVLGGFIGRAFVEPGIVGESSPRLLGAIAAAAVIGCLLFPLPIASEIDAPARIWLTAPDEAASRVEVAVDPTVVRDAEWFNVTAWQGGGSVIAPLVPVEGGVYRTQQAVPIAGDWKTLIRLHQDANIVAVPVYLPRDEAVSAAGVSAEATVTRNFIADKAILLREAKETQPWLSWVAYGLLGVLIVIWIAALAWGLSRLGRAELRLQRASRSSAPVTA